MGIPFGKPDCPPCNPTAARHLSTRCLCLEKIPFTSYDFWAYLSAGALLLVAADYLAGTEQLARADWTVMQGLIGVMTAYVLGQLVASLSAVVMERFLVKRILGFPRNVLFGGGRAPRIIRASLSGYFKALPTETQTAALARGLRQGIDGHGEALFMAAYAHATLSPSVMARLENFMNLYGFCRNMATVGFLCSAALACSHYLFGQPVANAQLAAGCALLAIGLTLRYLKFYRLFSVEVFTTYAYSKDPTSP